MNKKLMVAALAVTLIGGGIAGAALIPSANADAQTAKVTQTTQADNEKEVADDQVGQADNDKEVADDQAGQADNDKEVADDQAGQADNDKEIADDQEGKEDNDKEVSDDQAVTVAPSQAAVTKEQVSRLLISSFQMAQLRRFRLNLKMENPFIILRLQMPKAPNKKLMSISLAEPLLLKMINLSCK